MYNLTVQQAHTYFVGGQRWLVHNACSIVSRIKDNPYAVRLAERMSEQAQRDVDHLVGELAKGNLNAGIGSRNLGSGFIELRGRRAGRVIIKDLGDGRYEIVGKFQGHAVGDKANSEIIKRLMEGYPP